MILLQRTDCHTYSIRCTCFITSQSQLRLISWVFPPGCRSHIACSKVPSSSLEPRWGPSNWDAFSSFSFFSFHLQHEPSTNSNLITKPQIRTFPGFVWSVLRLLDFRTKKDFSNDLNSGAMLPRADHPSTWRGGLIKIQIPGPHPQRCRSSKSEAGPRNVHVWQAPRRSWRCWSVDYTWRSSDPRQQPLYSTQGALLTPALLNTPSFLLNVHSNKRFSNWQSATLTPLFYK